MDENETKTLLSVINCLRFSKRKLNYAKPCIRLFTILQIFYPFPKFLSKHTHNTRLRRVRITTFPKFTRFKINLFSHSFSVTKHREKLTILNVLSGTSFAEDLGELPLQRSARVCAQSHGCFRSDDVSIGPSRARHWELICGNSQSQSEKKKEKKDGDSISRLEWDSDSSESFFSLHSNSPRNCFPDYAPKYAFWAQPLLFWVFKWA